jgi:hypothetical protein
VDTFDEHEQLFRNIGLSEEAAKVAAIGRFRSEAEARATYAEDEADQLAEDLLGRKARGTAILAEGAPVVESAALTGLPLSVSEVALAARTCLSMTEADARSMATLLHARENRRGGPVHAEQFMALLALSLRRPVREDALR